VRASSSRALHEAVPRRHHLLQQRVSRKSSEESRRAAGRAVYFRDLRKGMKTAYAML
jgi:hypothetical protein